ncbi:MAG: FHA domain-containing protein, partial [Mobilicoccus sp.]|nr:FHA domain-containing protein [Mobilicoccus sp.]
AAARAGGRTPRDEPYGDVPHGYTDARRRPSDDDELRRHNAQRASDLAAWPDDDEADAHAGNEDNAAAEHPSHDWAPPRPERPERHDSAEPRERYEADPPRVLARRPWLELGVDSYPLLSAITVIGRDASADITLEDSGISRRHCEIRVTHDGPRIIASIRDLGSTNGTFVNGENVRSARLVEGDRITVGRSSLSVRFGER